MKNKLMFFAAIGLSCSLLLGGCGGTTSSSNNNTKTKEADKPEGQIVLKWYTDTDEISNKSLYKPEEIAAKFMEKNPNVKVEVQPLVANHSVADYGKKVDLMLASDEKIDILYFSTAEDTNKKILSGSIVPLNEFAKNSNIDLDTEYTNMLDFGGSYYTLAREDSVYLTFLNKNMLDEAGLPVPPVDWTWEDYAKYAEKLTKGEGVNKVYGSYFHSWPVMFQFGSVLDNGFYKEDGSANFDHPSFKTFFELRAKMENVQAISTPFVDIKTQNLAYRNEFFNGKVAMMPQGTWLLGDIKDIEKYPHTFKTTFATLPRLGSDYKANATIGTNGSGYAINSKCEHKQEAFDLIYFITTYGADMNKARISAWTKSDRDVIAKSVMGEDTNLYDLDAYNKVMDSDMVFLEPKNFPNYNSEIANVFAEETEKFISGIQDVDVTISNLQQRSNTIINKAK